MFWHDLADAVLLLSLVAGVIATFVSIRTSGVKEEYLKHELASMHGRAAHVELELAKLKTPRFLSPKKLQSLAYAIKPLASSLKDKVDFAASDDAESRQFAQIL